jgi:hypothetical protein
MSFAHRDGNWCKSFSPLGVRLVPIRSWRNDYITRHSDKEKFSNDLNGSKTSKMSERSLKTLQFFEDFQSEYSASLPSFRRSVPGGCIANACSEKPGRVVKVRRSVFLAISPGLFGRACSSNVISMLVGRVSIGCDYFDNLIHCGCVVSQRGAPRLGSPHRRIQRATVNTRRECCALW